MSNSETATHQFTNFEKNGRFIMATIGCIALGIQFGWPIGVATFCLLPHVLRAIKGVK
jgi:hypothetical protein